MVNGKDFQDGTIWINSAQRNPTLDTTLASKSRAVCSAKEHRQQQSLSWISVRPLLNLSTFSVSQTLYRDIPSQILHRICSNCSWSTCSWFPSFAWPGTIQNFLQIPLDYPERQTAPSGWVILPLAKDPAVLGPRPFIPPSAPCLELNRFGIGWGSFLNNQPRIDPFQPPMFQNLLEYWGK